MNAKKVVVMSDFYDVDGHCFAGIAKSMYPEANIVLSTYAAQEKTVKKLAEMEGDLLIVGDVNFKDYQLSDGRTAFEAITENFGKVMYYDHHSGTKRNLEKLEAMGVEVHYSADKCASKLLAEYCHNTPFAKNSGYTDLLGKIAQEYDYPSEEPDKNIKNIGLEMQKIISMFVRNMDYEHSENMISRLADKSFWNNWIRTGVNCLFSSDYDVVLNQYNQDYPYWIKELYNSKREVVATNRKFLLFLADPALPQKETYRRIREDHAGQADGYVIIFGKPVDNAIFLHDLGSDFQAEEFCFQNGGGGRGGDGGFTPEYSVDNSNYIEYVEVLKSKLSDFLK